MKNRKGFVSNSSSSSFILAIKEAIPCSLCGRSDLTYDNFIQMIEGSNDSDTEFRGEGLKEAEEWLESGYMEEDKLNEIKKKIRKLSKDNEIVRVDVSYCDEHITEIIKTSPNIQIVWSNE